MTVLQVFLRLPLVVAMVIISVSGFFVPVLLPVEAADLSTIRQRGRLIVAVKDNLPPLAFRSKNGELQGFEIDLARQLAADLLGSATAIEFRPVLNQDRFNAVLQNQVDLTIAHITVTPSRLRILNFSLPYYRDGAAIVTRDLAVQTHLQLHGRSIAVLSGSSTVETLHRQLPGAILIPVNSYQEAQDALETGRAIAVAADASVLAGWVQQFPHYRLILPILSSHQLAIALPKGQQYDDLRQEVDHTLTRLTNSGWLEQQARTWGLPRNFTF